MLTELCSYKQWVVRRSDKIPLRTADGKLASPINPQDWSDYQTARSCCTTTNGIGLGFVLTDEDPYTVIDLDDPTDPKHGLTPEEIAAAQALHMQIAERFDSYSELSPSGKGLHIWIKGKVPTGRKSSKRCVEIYSSARYMTITFKHFGWKPIKDCNEMLQQLWKDMGGVEPKGIAIYDGAATRSNEAVCIECANGANGNGQMFKELYSGNWQPYFASQSEADLALCNIIAFYSDNRNQTAEIFRASALGKRKKAQRDDYLFHAEWGIVSKSFDQKIPLVDFSALVKLTEQHKAEDTEEDVEEYEGLPPIDWQPPAGLMGDIASFIYQNSVNPRKEVAIAAAIAYLAGICGRSWNVSSTGLNQYLVLLGETGIGKESAAQGIDRLNQAVLAQIPAFARFIGPSEIASPQAIIKFLAESPCVLSRKGEFGLWLQKLTAKWAKSNEATLRGMLLDLYGKSGQSQTLHGAIYSDKQKNVPSVESPSLSIFGDSTQQEFFKAIDETNVGEGLVSRFTVIEAADSRPRYNSLHNKIDIPKDMVWRISGLVKMALEIEMIKTPITIQETEAAAKYSAEYREWCIDKMYEDRANPVLKLWNRAHLRLIRLAGLVAVSVDAARPVIQVEYLQWAAVLVNRSVEIVQRKFEQGQVGIPNSGIQQRAVVSRLIHKFCKSDFSEKWNKSYGINEEMHSARVVTHRYLLLNTNRSEAFRSSPNPSLALKTVIEDFINAGALQKVAITALKTNAKYGIAYYVLDMRALG